MLAFLIILPPCAIREQQAVQGKPSDCISSARQLEVIVFYLTAAAFFLSCQQAKESPQSSYVGDTKTVSHFSLSEQNASTVSCILADPRWGFPPSHQCHWNQLPGHHFVFLAIAPSFSSTFIHSFIFKRFSHFLLLSVLPTAADLAKAGFLSPSVIFFSPAAAFGCYLCKLDHQRHTTHSQ